MNLLKFNREDCPLVSFLNAIASVTKEISTPASQATTISVPDLVGHNTMSSGNKSNLLAEKTALRLSCRSPRNSPIQASSKTIATQVSAVKKVNTKSAIGPGSPWRSVVENLCRQGPTIGARTSVTITTITAAVNISERAGVLSLESSLMRRVLSPITQTMERKTEADWIADASPTARAGTILAATNQ
jgi:hypothetical protein